MSVKKYTISEAANILQYETHVLRFYESEFDIDVPRNKSNRREYTTKEIETFQYIKTLKDQEYNNNQIKRILKSPTVEEAAAQTQETEETSPIPYGQGNKSTQTKTNDVAIREISMDLAMLNDALFTNFNKINENIQKLYTTIDELKSDHFMEEKDVLVSENAKLKTRLKEKTYELVDIKEKFCKLEEKKFVFKKLFR